MKIPAKKCVKRENPKKMFHKKSFRWKKSGKAMVLVGCPKKEWMPRAKRCAVGLKAFEVVKPRRGACSTGYKKVG